MANHKSAIKRIRQTIVKNERNKYQHKTARTFIRRMRLSTDKKEVEGLMSMVTGMIDKLSKNNIIHKNKAANLKSSLSSHLKTLK